ncbi:MAG: hypothetical protein ACQKHC_00905 [Candidatus Phytoplasma pruni]
MAILMVVFSIIYISAFAAEENIVESEEPISEEIVSEETPLNIESEENIAENSDLTPPQEYQSFQKAILKQALLQPYWINSKIHQYFIKYKIKQWL